MLDLSTINTLVRRSVATLHIDANAHAEPTIDSLGKDALEVTVILKRGSDPLSGEAFGDLLDHVSDELEAAGESRLAIIRLRTDGEPMEDDGP